MATDTVDEVKKDLDALKNAVRGVTTADKDWLSALEKYFESFITILIEVRVEEILAKLKLTDKKRADFLKALLDQYRESKARLLEPVKETSFLSELGLTEDQVGEILRTLGVDVSLVTQITDALRQDLLSREPPVSQGQYPHLILAQASSLLNIPWSEVSANQAMRTYLDELRFLRLADKQLSGRVLQEENLSDAIQKAEAYLVVTDQAFEVLHTICYEWYKEESFFPKLLLSEDIKEKASSAYLARHGHTPEKPRGQELELLRSEKAPKGLSPLVEWLQKRAVSPAFEPGGTDLLFGKEAIASNTFLTQLKSYGDQQAFEQTRKLFENKRFSLSDTQIKNLTDSWGWVIDQLLEPSRKATEADVIRMRSNLATLYDRLETLVHRTDQDIVMDIASPNL